MKKAIKKLLPYEVEHLRNWLVYFTAQNPQLKPCLELVTEDLKLEAIDNVKDIKKYIYTKL